MKDPRRKRSPAEEETLRPAPAGKSEGPAAPAPLAPGPLDDEEDWAPDPRALPGDDLLEGAPSAELTYDPGELAPDEGALRPLSQGEWSEGEAASETAAAPAATPSEPATVIGGDQGFRLGEAKVPPAPSPPATATDQDLELDDVDALFEEQAEGKEPSEDADTLALPGRGDADAPMVVREEEMEFSPLRLESEPAPSPAAAPARSAAPGAPPRERTVETADLKDSAAEEPSVEITSVRRSLPAPVIPPVPHLPEASRTRLFCRKAVYSTLLTHAVEGLTRSDGGVQDPAEGAREVKGVLLGTILEHEGRFLVQILEAFPLPLREEDRYDRCSFGPVEDERVRQRLADLPFCGVVGYYHSHPDHDVFLSPFDVMTLNRRCGQPWCVAVVVQPREREVGFFIKIYDQRSEVPLFTGGQLPISRVRLDEWGRPVLETRPQGDDTTPGSGNRDSRRRRWPHWLGG
jgi:proteasome lid subunit RPN8/RPN11